MYLSAPANRKVLSSIVYSFFKENNEISRIRHQSSSDAFIAKFEQAKHLFQLTLLFTLIKHVFVFGYSEFLQPFYIFCQEHLVV